MLAPELEHLALRSIQLSRGMLRSAVMPCPQLGQRERGVTRLSGGSCGAGWPASSAHCARHSRSIILGSRWMTTLRNEPTQSPSTSATATNTAGWASQAAELMSSDSLPPLEDRLWTAAQHAPARSA